MTARELRNRLLKEILEPNKRVTDPHPDEYFSNPSISLKVDGEDFVVVVIKEP